MWYGVGKRSNRVPMALLARVPEPLRGRFNDERAAVTGEFLAAKQKPLHRDRRIWRWTIPARFTMLYIAALVGAYFALLLLANQLGLLRPFYWLQQVTGLPPVFILWIVALLALWIHGRMFEGPSRGERAAWRALNRIGIPTCEHCGYDCQGLEPTQCPECGQQLPTQHEVDTCH